MPRAPKTSLELLDLVRKSGIAASEKLAGVSDLTLPREPQKAAAALVSQGIVTQFQAAQLLAGRHKGFKIGAYTVLDLIGRGGMGAVYLAEHMGLHRKVAIKVLVPGKEDDQKLATERFQREARSAAALDHPNIVRIFDVARHNDVPYLVMEYVDGETLQELIDRDGPIPYTTATEYIAQAAAGLQHAHEKGFVHRDIKPGNLVLDKSGTIKILDMGLARSANAQDKLTALLDNGAVVGTADFIAPEQAINNPAVDIRADIYSLGATLFSLIIGKPPFDGNTTQKLLQHQLRSAPQLDSLDATLPKALSQVVAKMLSKKPDERYSTPAEVISALTPWMANSARILVGISQTSLAEDESLQASLSGFHRRNLQPLPSIADSSDSSSEFQVLESGKETETLASSDTRREKKQPLVSPFQRLPYPKILLPASVLVLVLCILGACWAFGRGKKPKSDPVPAASQPEQQQNQNGDEKVVFRFDAATQTPFNIRMGWVDDTANPANKVLKVLRKSGSGEPPTGWKAQSSNNDSEMEYFAESFNGKTALGIRTTRGPGPAMLFMPSFDSESSMCRLKVDYQASLKEKMFSIKFKPSDDRPSWEVATPQVTGNIWRTEDLLVDLKGAKGGLFEFHNLDSSTNASLRLRSVTVTQLKNEPVPAN